MKLGKKIGAASMAFALAAGITAGGSFSAPLQAQAAEYSGFVCQDGIWSGDNVYNYAAIAGKTVIDSAHCKTDGKKQSVELTVTSALKTNDFNFAVYEDIKGQIDNQCWSVTSKKWINVDNQKGCGITLKPGETVSLIVDVNSKHLLGKVRGVYVSGDTPFTSVCTFAGAICTDGSTKFKSNKDVSNYLDDNIQVTYDFVDRVQVHSK